MAIIKCPECGSQVSDKAQYCVNCGVAIKDNINICPDCGKVLLKEERVCNNCGYKLDENITSQANVYTQTKPQENVDTYVHKRINGEYLIPKNSNKKSILFFIAFILLLALVIGGYFLHNYRVECEQIDNDYAMLDSCDMPELYEQFLQKHPQCKYSEDVRNRLNAIIKLDNEWQQISESGRKMYYYRFAKKYPNSKYVQVCERKIDSIDWQDAKNTNRIVAFENYLKLHADGCYADSAKNEIEIRKAYWRAKNDSLLSEPDAMVQ